MVRDKVSNFQCKIGKLAKNAVGDKKGSNS